MNLRDTASEMQCCLVTKVDDVASLSKKGCLKDKKLYSTALMGYQVQALSEFVPAGIQLTDGFTAFATLDFSPFSSFGDLVVSIQIDGSQIAAIPETNFLDLPTLITAVVDAINGSPVGYQATDNGDSTVTVEAPNAGSSVNGFIVEVQINPTFALVQTLSFDSTRFRQMIHVNDPTSGLYRYTLIAKLDATVNQSIEAFFNRALASSAFIGNNGVWGAYALTRQENVDRLWTSAILPGGVFTVLNNDLTVNSYVTTGVGSTDAIFNTFNNCLYFAVPAANRVTKIDASGTQTNITGVTGAIKVDFDPVSGRVWAIGTNSLFLIDPTTNVVTPVATPAEQAVDIAYWPAGTPLMLVAFTTSNVIRTYTMAGTVDTASWYSVSAPNSVFYSAIYNNIWAGFGTGTVVIKTDGTLKQTLTELASKFAEDEYSGDIIAANTNLTPALPSYVWYYALSDDGSDVIDGALEEGVDPTYTDGEGNCAELSDMESLAQKLVSKCGCANCGSGSTTAETITPSGNTYVIYYGNSSNAALDFSGVAALTSTSITTYVGTYSYAATVPSEYKYIAIPVDLGTPSRFYDVSTGFDVAMDTSYEVTINLVTYNVWRTYYKVGSDITIGVTS